MGYVPPPFPPRDLFKSDEEWYIYCRNEIEVAQKTANYKGQNALSIAGIIAVTMLIIYIGMLFIFP